MSANGCGATLNMKITPLGSPGVYFYVLFARKWRRIGIDKKIDEKIRIFWFLLLLAHRESRYNRSDTTSNEGGRVSWVW